MAVRRRPVRGRGRDLRAKSRRKRVSPLVEQKVTYVDYKDVELLKSFVSERAKIRAQRVSGNNRQQQREVARAVKNAREMALLAYVRRPTTQRRPPKRREGPRDGSRPNQPWDPSSPAVPPPGPVRPSDAPAGDAADDTPSQVDGGVAPQDEAAAAASAAATSPAAVAEPNDAGTSEHSDEATT